MLNGRLQHVPDGELGEVYITGNNVVERYLTVEHEGSFVELKDEGGKLVRLYRTGDWGLIQNGCLIYQGISVFSLNLLKLKLFPKLQQKNFLNRCVTCASTQEQNHVNSNKCSTL